AVPLLVGLGLDEFSMSASSVLKTRSLMKRLDSKEMEKLADKAINECTTVEEVIALVEEMKAKLV
ncbi:MAG: phosphoenolpyruvate--protein phosphotransferase, partial [Trichococcus flocculiformis]|nr:phosphoenolpyruvate--protein phosphotransferase [Trichococcus flocculiformis]